jgi:hypothetical protein
MSLRSMLVGGATAFQMILTVEDDEEEIDLS